MPYIITTTIPPTKFKPVAWATLDEARREAEGTILSLDKFAEDGPDGPAFIAGVKQAASLPAQGGAVGPLPDGTTIEVERVDMGRIKRIVLDRGEPIRHNDAIAAYNAAN